jgi:hypothetical protein
MLVYFTSIWAIFRPLGIFYIHWVYVTPFYYIFTRFGTLYEEKSGNPVLNCQAAIELNAVFLFQLFLLSKPLLTIKRSEAAFFGGETDLSKV